MVYKKAAVIVSFFYAYGKQYEYDITFCQKSQPKSNGEHITIIFNSFFDILIISCASISSLEK